MTFTVISFRVSSPAGTGGSSTIRREPLRGAVHADEKGDEKGTLFSICDQLAIQS